MPKIYRTDLLTHQMNPGKEGGVRALLKAWRKDCIQEAKLSKTMVSMVRPMIQD